MTPGGSGFPTPETAVERAARLIDEARRVVVLTGAGISTDSGIPDFRGPKGLWTKNPGAEKAATIDVYRRDPEVRRRGWRRHLERGWRAEPNVGHRALVALEERGKLDTLITQNIDSLHHLAGNDPARIVEVHGNVREYVCLGCGDGGPIDEILERVGAGEDDPHCRDCGGLLKSATISFGQSLVMADLERADDAARGADLLLAVGSTLTVSPICDVVPIAAATGARVVIVNAEPTQFDYLADVVLYESISEILPRLVGMSTD